LAWLSQSVMPKVANAAGSQVVKQHHIEIFLKILTAVTSGLQSFIFPGINQYYRHQRDEDLTGGSPLGKAA